MNKISNLVTTVFAYLEVMYGIIHVNSHVTQMYKDVGPIVK